MNIFDILKKVLPGASTTETTLPSALPEKTAAMNAVFEKLVVEYTALITARPHDRVAVSAMPTYPEIKNAPDTSKKEWLFFMANVVVEVKQKYGSGHISHYAEPGTKGKDSMRFLLAEELQRILLKTSFPITEDELTKLINLYADHLQPHAYDGGFPKRPLISRVEQLCKGKPIPDALGNAMRRMVADQAHYLTQEHKADNQKIELLLSAGTDIQIDPNDDWGHEMVNWLGTLTTNEKQPWINLLEHCMVGGAKTIPNDKWIKEAEKLLLIVGADAFVQKMQDWLLFNTCLLKAIHKNSEGGKSYLRDVNMNLLKGLIWCCALPGESSLQRSLLDYANTAYKKKPGTGPIAVSGGSACMHVFSRLPVKEGVPLLLAVRNKTDNKAILKTLDKLINEVAQKNSISPDTIEEIAAPGFGMQNVGELTLLLGEYSGCLKVLPDNSTVLTFEKNGKIQSSVPAAVKQHFDAELKTAKQTQKAIEEQLRAHTQRLENSYLKPRQWIYAEWAALYLHHPLLAVIGRKIIWHFDTDGTKQQGIYQEGQLVDALKMPLQNLNETTTVQLWHPIGFDAAYVLQWRNYFRTNEIVQPFKQAFREVYLLTDAELRTFSYSNRFAAHIVRQHQLAALARQRGWDYTLMGSWDCDSRPVKTLANWGIVVEFFVNANWDSTTSEAGIFTYIATDQVRFKKDGQILNMDEIPAMVFTEVMRDVDLFVGVCSVGNDQNWMDGGNQRINTYWHNYSFSDLGESAKVRIETLQFLIPKMKIAGQCSFNKKFLYVQGKLRKYKIHIGSGNILMQPNDQYLCIVPGGRTKETEKLFLPFEGDTMLSIIISKALLLAEDDTITDTTITRQLTTSL